MKLVPFTNKTASEVATLSGQTYPKVCAYVSVHDYLYPTWGIKEDDDELVYVTTTTYSGETAATAKASGIVFIP